MVALVAAVLFLARQKHDAGTDSGKTTQQPRSNARQQVLAKVQGMHAASEGLRGRARIAALRRYMDSMNDELELVSDIRPAREGEPNGEWVIAPGSDLNRRILYLHGGS
jgi:monoterpene epsilon-lactone hydrolase